jgi:hypothetical protein
MPPSCIKQSGLISENFSAEAPEFPRTPHGGNSRGCLIDVFSETHQQRCSNLPHGYSCGWINPPCSVVLEGFNGGLIKVIHTLNSYAPNNRRHQGSLTSLLRESPVSPGGASPWAAFSKGVSGATRVSEEVSRGGSSSGMR